MIRISNTDRDKTVEFLKAYASMLKLQGYTTTREANTARIAQNLANKLERKKPE